MPIWIALLLLGWGTVSDRSGLRLLLSLLLRARDDGSHRRQGKRQKSVLCPAKIELSFQGTRKELLGREPDQSASTRNAVVQLMREKLVLAILICNKADSILQYILHSGSIRCREGGFHPPTTLVEPLVHLDVALIFVP